MAVHPTLRRLAAASLLAALSAAPAVRAQEAADTVRLPELVATATRLPTAPTGIVASRTLFTGEELAARGIRFVADALRDVPGVSLVQSAPFGAQASLFLRGGNSDYVKVLVDGVPLNQPGGLFNFANLTTDNVERIEVVRGPAAVLYGADAVTGVIQVFTRRGQGPWHGAVAAQGGSYGSGLFDASAAGSHGIVSASAQAGWVRSDGTYDFNNGYRNGIGSARVSVVPDARTDATFVARYTDARYRFPTDFSGVPVDSNQVNSERVLTLGLDAGRTLVRGLQARVLLGVTETRAGFDDGPDNAADTTGYGYAGRSRSALARRSGDVRLVGRLRPDVTVIGGLFHEFERERLEDRTTSNFGGGPTTDASTFRQDRTTTAPYLQAVADLRNGLAVNAGVRLDDNSAFGTFTTGRLGAAWRVGHGLRVRASVGNAFKAPKFREQFIRSPYEVGNPALRPERSTTWEAGVEQALAGSRVTLGLTWFDSRFRDLIQYAAGSDPSAPTYFNLGAALARGLEAEVRAAPWRAVTVGAQYTWLETKVTDAGASASPVFEDGQRLLRRPAHSGRVYARWSPSAGTSVGANVNVIGRRDDVDFNAFPAERRVLSGYALVEVSGEAEVVHRAPGRPGVAATWRLENLFDATYDAVLGFPGRGRTLLAGARLLF